MDFGSAAAGEDKWRFSWKWWETVSNIFLLISLTLLQKACHELLSGEMELGEEKLTAGAREEDGCVMEVMIVLRNGRCEGEKSSHGWGASGNSRLRLGWCLKPSMWAWTPEMCVLLPRWIIEKLSISPVSDHTAWLHNQSEHVKECKSMSEQLLLTKTF